MRFACVILFVLFSTFVFAQSSLPDACKILTADDVQKVMGSGFTASHYRENTKEHSECAYTKDANNNVAISILPSPSADAAETMKALRQMFTTQGRKVVPISDPLEGAFYVDSVNPMTKQHVIITHFAKGGFHASVDVRVNGNHDPDLEEKIAKAAYAKFP